MNADSRPAWKRKAIDALEPPPRPSSPTSEQTEAEHQFFTRSYEEVSALLASWSLDYLIDDLDDISEDRVHAIIAKVDGFCDQSDWETLRAMLPPSLRVSSAQVFGELLIRLTIKERLFENTFRYLNGKRGPSDQGEDLSFAEKLNYLFERFYGSMSLIACLEASADSVMGRAHLQNSLRAVGKLNAKDS
ncbi:hypothetical protein BJY00DRAFT_320151 [Aspergillus carlsbadensis]|nr:hypothetical protein BJY00DRAFT_320151 [Aspergillus carlsbadensis]